MLKLILYNKLCNKLYNKLYELYNSEKNNFPLWIPFLLALGAIIYFSLENEPSYKAISLIISFIILFTILFIILSAILFIIISKIAQFLIFITFIKLCIYKIKIIIYISLFICLGFLAAKIRTEMLSTKVLTKEGYFNNLSGIVRDISHNEKHKSYTKLLIELDNKSKVKLISRIKSNDEIEIGNKILFSAYLKHFSGPITPFGYDGKMYAYFNGIIATGFITKPIKIIDKNKNSSIFSKIREKINKNFQQNLDQTYSGIASALVIGKKDGISKEILQDFRNSGTAHLLAISGLHLSLVSMIIFNLIRFLLALSETIAIKFDTKKIASIFSIIFSFFYLQIAGAPVSAERAFIMISIFFLSILIDRRSNVLRSIAFAATFIIIFSPENVLMPGFQMSFFAVLGICSRLINFKNLNTKKDPGITKKFFTFFINMITSSSLAIFATFPFAVYHFNNFSLNGVIANLFAIPIVTFCVIPLLIFILILMPLFSWAFLYKLIALSLSLLIQLNHEIAKIDIINLSIHSFSGSILLLLTFGMLVLFLFKTHLKYLGFIPIIIALFFASQYEAPDIFLTSNHIALKGADNKLYLLEKKSKNFITKSWAIHSNHDSNHDKNIHFFTEHKNTEKVKIIKQMNRDSYHNSYIYEKDNKKVLFSYEDSIIDCSKYDYIFELNSNSPRKCASTDQSKYHFNSQDIKNGKVIFVWLNNNKIKLSSVNRKWTGNYTTSFAKQIKIA